MLQVWSGTSFVRGTEGLSEAKLANIFGFILRYLPSYDSQSW